MHQRALCNPNEGKLAIYRYLIKFGSNFTEEAINQSLTMSTVYGPIKNCD